MYELHMHKCTLLHHTVIFDLRFSSGDCQHFRQQSTDAIQNISWQQDAHVWSELWCCSSLMHKMCVLSPFLNVSAKCLRCKCNQGVIVCVSGWLSTGLSCSESGHKFQTVSMSQGRFDRSPSRMLEHRDSPGNSLDIGSSLLTMSIYHLILHKKCYRQCSLSRRKHYLNTKYVLNHISLS